MLPADNRKPGTGNRERRRLQSSLGRRLLVALLLAGLLPVAIAGYLTWREQERVLRREALDRAQQVAQLLAARVHRFVRGPREDLAVLAATPELRTAILHGNWKLAQRILGTAARHHPDLRATLVADASGRARAATGVATRFLGQDVSTRPHFALARMRRKLMVSDPFPSPLDQRPVIGLAVPILDGDRVAAELGAAMDLSLLAEELQRVQLGAGGFAVVQTAEGRIIVHRDQSRLFHLAPEGNRATTFTRRGPTGSLETMRPDGTRDLTGFATVADLNWVVLAQVPKEQALASLAALRQRTLTLLGWLLAMAGVFALVYGRVLARPMNHLAEAAQALGAGDLSRRVPTLRSDEFGEVARAFNEMADRRQRAEAALQVSLARRDALNGLSAAIAAGTDRAAIVRQVVEATARLLGAPYAVLWTPDPQGARLIPAAEFVDPSLGPLPPQPAIPANASLANSLSDGTHILAVPDVRGHPRWANQTWPGLQVLGSYIGLHLEADGRPAGVLNALDRRGRTFTSEEIELLRSLGTHAVLAIERARLLEDARRAAAQSHALVEVGKLLTETVDLDTVLARVVKEAGGLLHASACGVALIEPSEGEAATALRFVQAHGLPQAYRQAHTMRPGESVTGKAIQELRAVWSPDITTDPGIWLSDMTRRRVLEHEVPRAILAAPMARERSAIGALVVYRPAGSAYSPAEVQALTVLASQAAIAIENARLFRQQQERQQQVDAVRAVSEEIARELDPATVLGLVIRRATDLLRASAGTVWLWNEADQVLTPRAWQGYGEWLRGERRRLGEGAVGIVALRREGLILNEFRSWPHAPPAIRERSPVAAVVAEPLLYRERLVGVIILDRLEGDAPFTEEDRKLLSLFAAQAAIAIENARLFQATKEGAQEIAAIHEAGWAITESLDLNTTLARIAESARRLAGADRSFVWLVDPRDGSLEAAIALGPGTETFIGTSLPAESPAATARAAREGRPLAVPNALDAAAADPALSARFGNAALLAVPLSFREKILGILVCGYNHPRAFAPGEVNRLAALAQQAAIAIENARLYDETQRRAREATALAEVGRTLSGSLDMERVLDVIVAEVRRLMEAPFAGLMMVDEERQELRYVKGAGLSLEHVAEVRLKVGEGIAGRAVGQRGPVQSPRLLADPRYVSPGLAEAQGFRSVLSSPLLAGGRPLGALVVFRRDEREFSPAEVQLLTSFADQASLAMENARLYGEVRDHSNTLERKVAERTAELEAANRAKSEFLANMSHELRTPLNAIIGFADLLRMPSFGTLTQKQEKYVGNIQTSGVHLLNLVNDVLDLARVEAGRLELRLAPTPLGPAIADALDNVRIQADAKGLTMALEAEPGLPAVLTDPVRLRQILVNLLSNAVKFTEPGGRVTVTVRATPASPAAGGGVEIQVHDTGIGIAPEDLGRLFRKFEQLDGGPAKAHQGAGLGLALTKHLVELHGGTITARSAGRGQGSTFTVRLPLGPQRERPLVLIVDDDLPVRETLAATVRDWGWDGQAVCTLAEALAALQESQPDVVILDSKLPDGSGAEVVRQIRRALAHHVPVLMYTGLGAQEGQIGLRAGADEYLVKPAPQELLHRKASQLLARAGWRERGEGAGMESPEAPLPSTPVGREQGREQ